MTSKETLLKQIEAQKKKWEAQIKDLDAKVTGFEANTRAKIDEQMEYLQAKMQEVQKQADKIKNTGEENWQQMNENIINAWNDITEKINYIISNITKQK